MQCICSLPFEILSFCLLCYIWYCVLKILGYWNTLFQDFFILVKCVNDTLCDFVIDSIVWYHEFRLSGSFLLDSCNLSIQQRYPDGVGYFTNCYVRSHHATACWS
jgi:hypothetical protein